MAAPAMKSPERADPTLPKSGVNLKFDGDDLHLLIGPAELAKYGAVSGLPPYDCSPEGQQQANKGPIPEGIYWIRPDEMEATRFIDQDSWGPYRIPIHAFLSTVTFGRGGFYIHGGSVEGSLGCIDLVDLMDRFRADLMTYIGNNTAVQVHLTVDYSTARLCPTKPILK